ncbi:hypothetical protein TNCV_3104961 [Trichonephila clavipes]|nr:hypothetical protein TNCV_3104961 [Trichonephila clavipes]
MLVVSEGILTPHCLATRGLLTTGVVILNHRQVTRTTPELAPFSPNYHTTPTGGPLDRFNGLHCFSRRVFSGIGQQNGKHHFRQAQHQRLSQYGIEDCSYNPHAQRTTPILAAVFGVVVEWTCRDTATRGLLETDLVILNHDQVTRVTPELEPLSPNYHTTTTGGRLSSPQT